MYLGRCTRSPCSFFRGESHVCSRKVCSLFRKYRIRSRNMPLTSILTLASYTEPVTDKSVPDGHKSLHEYLYGEDAEAVHAASEANQEAEQQFTDEPVGVSEFLSEREGQKLAGVYAIFNSLQALQYIGYARDISWAVKAHLKGVGPDSCHSIQVRVLGPNKIASRNSLQALAADWLSEIEFPPPGNSTDSNLWEVRPFIHPSTKLRILPSESNLVSVKTGHPVLASQDTSSRASGTVQYEERKVKLQKAMGEKNNNELQASTSQERRETLERAMTGDWSAVIEEQTLETLAQEGTPSRPALAFTVANVDMALDKIRPILVADGGNVEVIGAENGVVTLSLQGACGTCSSSTATLKNIIETTLREDFGSAFERIEQTGAGTSGSSREAVDAHLDNLRPAIQGYGGSVEVLEVSPPVCKVKYSGLPQIKVGLMAAIKDKFPDILEVVVIEGSFT